MEDGRAVRGADFSLRPDFIEPTDRLRRLGPDTLVYSYEWFEDDPKVIEAVQRFALAPVTLPHGWTLGDVPDRRSGPRRTHLSSPMMIVATRPEAS